MIVDEKMKNQNFRERLFGKRAVIYSILIIFMLGSLFLFILFYISTFSSEDKIFLNFNDVLLLNSIISDVRGDVSELSSADVLVLNDSLILANISSHNYSSYIQFLTSDYSKKINVPINIILNDSFYSASYVIFPDKVLILNGTFFKADLATSCKNLTLTGNTLSSGPYNFKMNFFNISGAAIVSIDQNINLSKYQYLLFSCDVYSFNVTIFDGVIYKNYPFGSLSTYLNKTEIVYFGSFLNISVGDYRYEGMLRYI